MLRLSHTGAEPTHGFGWITFEPEEPEKLLKTLANKQFLDELAREEECA